MQGSGIILRDSRINPPDVRKILVHIGDIPVTSLQLVRTPLAKTTTFLLNIASFGQLENKLKETDIDKLFHLSLLINGKFTLEKNEVISLKMKNPITKESETLVVPVPQGITINSLISNTQKRMGNKYGEYNALDNNCGIFVQNILDANGLSTKNSNIFLSQKVPELYEKFPSLTKYITNLATDAGAFLDRQIHGEGNR